MRMRHPSPFKRRRQLVLVALGEFWCLWLHCHRWVRGCRIGGPGSVIGGWHLTVPSTVSQHSAVRASLADSYMYRVLSLRRGRLHDAMSAASLTGGLFARGCVAVRDGRANGEPGGRHVLENSGWAGISIISQARLAGSPNPHHEIESKHVFSSSAYGILSRPDAFECVFFPADDQTSTFHRQPFNFQVQPQNRSKFRREILRRRHHPTCTVAAISVPCPESMGKGFSLGVARSN